MTLRILGSSALLAAAILLASPVVGSNAALAQCDPGTRINGTTADQAKRVFEKAGYRQVRELKKGCDSVWHAVAVKDGNGVRVALSPTGEIMPEND